MPQTNAFGDPIVAPGSTPGLNAFGDPIQTSATSNAEFHPLDSIGHGISEFWKQVDPVAAAKGIHAALQNPTGTAKETGRQNVELWNKTKDAYNKGEYVEAVRHALNYGLNGIPGIGYGIDQAGDKFNAGDIAGGVGQSLGIGVSAAAPAVVPKVANAVSSGLRSTAIPLAESGLGVRAIQRAYGKTPGAAILDETTGIQPADVAESARAKLSDLNTQLEDAANRSTTPGSLAPARDIIDQRIARAQAGNSTYVPPVGRGRVPELGQMREQLSEPGPNFQGNIAPTNQPAPGAQGPSGPLKISDVQDPATILRMKREFGNDFTKWNPLHPQNEMGTARQVYRALDSELDRSVPGSSELNQRISSLIPVAERAESTDLNAGLVQNLLHRAAAHTGALVSAAAGYSEAGPLGAIAGFVLPELAASPVGRLAVSRAVNSAAKLAAKTTTRQIAQGAAAAGATVGKYTPGAPVPPPGIGAPGQ